MSHHDQEKGPPGQNKTYSIIFNDVSARKLISTMKEE